MDFMARTHSTDRPIVERWIGRLFVALGAAFWASMTLGAQIGYLDKTLPEAARQEWISIVLIVVILLIAWFYEVIAALILFAGAAATVVWGVVAGWELGVWFLMGSLFIAPAIIAGLLFLAANRAQSLYDAEGAAK